MKVSLVKLKTERLGNLRDICELRQFIKLLIGAKKNTKGRNLYRVFLSILVSSKCRLSLRKIRSIARKYSTVLPLEVGEFTNVFKSVHKISVRV
jgi:hypothetical protein